MICGFFALNKHHCWNNDHCIVCMVTIDSADDY